MMRLNGLACGIFVLCVTMVVASSAQTLATLASFDGAKGAFPYGALIQGTDGNFYGTTEQGGVNSSGTVFKITADGVLTTLYSFCMQANCVDGSFPQGGLVQASNGNFYGTTNQGGQNSLGTVFKITPEGEFTTLRSFCTRASCSDGTNPVAGLIQGSDGNLYGTTQLGGIINGDCTLGCGTFFKITVKGTLTTLYSFCLQANCADGSFPQGSLTQASNRNFYGSTNQGGQSGLGSAFEITPQGELTTIHSFCTRASCSDGTNPTAGLIRGTDGNFYGTASLGGILNQDCTLGCGTFFEISAKGSFTPLYGFCLQANCTDGSFPEGGLVQGTDGNFYGTTNQGGQNDLGTAFEMSPEGSLAALRSFCIRASCSDGTNPVAAMIQGTDGDFYGSTQLGGMATKDCLQGCGTVFSLSTGLSPFVALARGFGSVGQTVRILGQGFTGTTAVSFHGTNAPFSVKSDTFLTATVPAGAVTGSVRVSTPAGVLRSNGPFQVIQPRSSRN